jgi:hypothetical protein
MSRCELTTLRKEISFQPREGKRAAELNIAKYRADPLNDEKEKTIQRLNCQQRIGFFKQ